MKVNTRNDPTIYNLITPLCIVKCYFLMQTCLRNIYSEMQYCILFLSIHWFIMTLYFHATLSKGRGKISDNLVTNFFLFMGYTKTSFRKCCRLNHAKTTSRGGTCKTIVPNPISPFHAPPINDFIKISMTLGNLQLF